MGFLYLLPQKVIVLVFSLMITSCVILKRDSQLLSVALQENLTEIPVKYKHTYGEFTQYKILQLEMPSYKVDLYGHEEEIVAGEVNFPGRLTVRIETRFIIEETRNPDMVLKTDGIITFEIIRQGILANSTYIAKLYGKTFPNKSNEQATKYFTIAGTAHETLPELFIQSNDYLPDGTAIKITMTGSLFEKNIKLAQRTETGFLLYKDKKIVGFLNKIGYPRVFIDTSLPQVEQDAILKSILFLIIYSRPKNIGKRIQEFTFEEEQAEIKKQYFFNE